MKFIAWLMFWVLLWFLVMVTTGCGSLRKHLWTGGGAAGGAVAGAVVGGPLGAAVGGAAGAIGVGAVSEAQEYRSGDVIGEEALARELARWKGAAYVAQATAEVAEEAADWKAKLFRWGLWAGVLYFVIRNRNYLLKFGPGYLHGLWHSIVGGKHPDAPPIPSDPPEDLGRRRISKGGAR